MKRLIILSLTFSLLAPIGALAATVTVDADTIVTMTGGTSFTMNTNTLFESMTINESSVDYSLSSDGVLYLTSSTRGIFNVTGVENIGRSTICNTNNSTIVIRHDQATTTNQTATVSYNSTGCEAAAGSGGGGGGGNGPPLTPNASPVPTPIPAPTIAPNSSSSQSLIDQLLRQIADISAQIAILQGVPALPAQSSTKAKIARALAFGSHGPDVSVLQAFLALDTSVYPEGIVSGYFGKLTQQALKRFQKKYGIDQVGITGPKTRAKLNQLMAQ